MSSPSRPHSDIRQETQGKGEPRLRAVQRALACSRGLARACDSPPSRPALPAHAASAAVSAIEHVVTEVANQPTVGQFYIRASRFRAAALVLCSAGLWRREPEAAALASTVLLELSAVSGLAPQEHVRQSLPVVVQTRNTLQTVAANAQVRLIIPY